MRGQVIPGIEARGIAGFRSIDLLRRERDHDVEFMTLMRFDTLGSVKEFMGEDYETAVTQPRSTGCNGMTSVVIRPASTSGKPARTWPAASASATSSMSTAPG